MKKLIVLVFVAVWLFLMYMAFFGSGSVEALGKGKVNRCQEVLQQIATSHEVNLGDTFNNPHPGCVPHTVSQVIEFQPTKVKTSQRVIVNIPVLPTENAISTPAPTDTAPITEPTQPAVTETSTPDPTQPPATEPQATERTCNPHSPGDNTNSQGNHNCSGHQPDPNSKQENNKEN